ncbi:DUF2461 family protein [Ruminococcus sp.]|uniref:DUF2461 family protein n=1 Tax=Ruminococcus sp. TaxID=41978 RepID=UPI001B706EE3|nr:DUF2461 family protein [Ruminococcus sp.]MBP5431832.1 DUF2461 family protein [Ruminococcus sp.]
MFKGFSQDALEFLLGIRHNNNKEWFEPRKLVYTEKVYEPLKALGEELFTNFADIDGMMYKVGRIYRDENLAPYLHYRDTLWIYVRYDAWYWNKTPTLYFELSPEGAEFGFRISKPEAAVMERFRSGLLEDADSFLNMVDDLVEKYGLTLGGEEYKRKKSCPVPELERFFVKKGFSLYTKVGDPTELFSRKIAEHTVEVFQAVQPLNDYFHEIVEMEELAKELLKDEKPQQSETEIKMVKAPSVEFMW